MISTVKREIAIEKELRSKIEWACTFSISNLANKYPLSRLRDFISGN